MAYLNIIGSSNLKAIFMKKIRTVETILGKSI